jgi:hypothetical protein
LVEGGKIVLSSPLALLTYRSTACAAGRLNKKIWSIEIKIINPAITKDFFI